MEDICLHDHQLVGTIYNICLWPTTQNERKNQRKSDELHNFMCITICTNVSVLA